jgi:hypothetical protein
MSLISLENEEVLVTNYTESRHLGVNLTHIDECVCGYII